MLGFSFPPSSSISPPSSSDSSAPERRVRERSHSRTVSQQPGKGCVAGSSELCYGIEWDRHSHALSPHRSGAPTPASNGWIGVSSSVSQRPSELQSLLPRSPSLILSFLQCVELKGKCPVRSIRIVLPPPPPFLLSLLLRRRRRLLIRINTELTFLLLHYQDMDRRCLLLMLPFYPT